MGIWIARNSDGTIELYHEKPVRGKTHFKAADEGFLKGWIADLGDADYPEVTWKNSPKELTIKRSR